MKTRRAQGNIMAPRRVQEFQIFMESYIRSLDFPRVTEGHQTVLMGTLVAIQGDLYRGSWGELREILYRPPPRALVESVWANLKKNSSAQEFLGSCWLLPAFPGFRFGPARSIFHVEGRVQDKSSGDRRIRKDTGSGKSQEKPGGARRSQREPGRVRQNQGEPGRARRPQEDPGGPI